MKNAIIPNPYQGLTPKQVIDTMQQLVDAETQNHLLMGLLYNYLMDSQLLENTKNKDPLEFICSNVQDVSRSALLLYSAVARAFRQETCSQFGVYRLRYLLTYKEAAKIELNYEQPGGTFIQVPDKQGQPQPKLFSDCTVGDMRKALVHLRQSEPQTPVPAELRKLVDQYREAVIGNFPQGSPVRVQMRTYKDEVVVDFKAIPVLQVRKLLEALIDHLDTGTEMPAVQQEPVAAGTA